MAITHWILQGKGGVGKSLIAGVLLQYLRQKGLPASGIDTDPVNHTLGGYHGLEVKTINILGEDNVDARKFDDLMEHIFSAGSDEHLVIDNGASSFLPLLSYLKENKAIGLLQDNGHQVFLHSVLTGGQSMLDTLSGLRSLCVTFALPVVVWLNLYFGEIKDQGKNFEEFNLYQEFKHQLRNIVSMPSMNKDTYGKDVQDLLARKQSFAEAINSSMPIMVRQRLKTYWSMMALAIEQSGFIQSENVQEQIE